jgi:hypothetical protein
MSMCSTRKNIFSLQSVKLDTPLLCSPFHFFRTSLVQHDRFFGCFKRWNSAKDQPGQTQVWLLQGSIEVLRLLSKSRQSVAQIRSSWLQRQEYVWLFNILIGLLYEECGDGPWSGRTALSFQGMYYLHIHQPMILYRTGYVEFTDQHISTSGADRRM